MKRRALRQTEAVAATVERVAVGLLVASMVVLVATQVVARYLLDSPLVWTEEAARFALVWLTFLGAGLLALEKGHVAVDLFAAAKLARFRPYVQVFAAIVQLVVCAVVTYAGVRYWSFLGDTRSPALRLPMRLVFVAVTAGFGLWTVHTLAHAVRELPGLVRRRPAEPHSGDVGDAEQHGAL